MYSWKEHRACVLVQDDEMSKLHTQKDCHLGYMTSSSTTRWGHSCLSNNGEERNKERLRYIHGERSDNRPVGSKFQLVILGGAVALARGYGAQDCFHFRPLEIVSGAILRKVSAIRA